MRAYHFLISVTVAWSCGFYSVGLGQEGALPVTTDLHAHGLNEQQLDSLADILQHAVDQQAIAGCSFLIVHRGEVVFREAFGFADIELERAFTTNELVPIASVSKPVLASVVMALVDQGKLTLDDPVEKYLPEFKDMKVKGGKHLARRMTIRHLLSHTAGFWGNKGISAEKLDLIRNFQRPLGEAVSRMATYELEYQPGAKFVYSGSGFCVAGRVAEVVLNQSLEQIAQEVLFRPLGLRHTTYLPSKEIDKVVVCWKDNHLAPAESFVLFCQVDHSLPHLTNWPHSGLCTLKMECVMTSKCFQGNRLMRCGHCSCHRR